MAPRYAKDQPAGFTNRIEKVAIVGVRNQPCRFLVVGGQVGTYITKHLLNTGKHTVTAITRTDSTTQLPEGVKAAKVDYDNEQSLVDALKGQQFLIVSMAVAAPKDTEQKLIKAAAKAGVPWILPNSYTADLKNKVLSNENLAGAGVLASIEAIEKEGMSSWVALVSSFWYEYSLAMSTQFYGFDTTNKKIEFIDNGNTKINTTTWDQSARAIAALLSLKELPEDENDKSVTLSRWRNEPLYVSSFLVSQRDMLASLNRVLGTKDSDWETKSEPHQERYNRGLKELQEGNMLGFATALYTRVFYPNGDGNYEAKYGLANEALGLPKEDLDEATKAAVAMVQRGWNPYTNRN
ncbi:oxidoreductase CipA [Tolypocladium capitatum]|uniref:Oxidoreductase CipA n=1 Tax=Tolypocladium capitatum TaxID=45235 RepID=A0A2K3QPH4_9HYPO|nr:oxidoreductase CipA [Tolypocladium capitatum]